MQSKNVITIVSYVLATIGFIFIMLFVVFPRLIHDSSKNNPSPASWYCDEGNNTCSTTDTGGTSYTEDQGNCKDKCKSSPASWYCDESNNTCSTTDTGGTSYTDQGSCKDKCKPPPASWYCDEGNNTCSTTDTGGTSYTDQGSCKDKCKPPPASWYCDEGTSTCSTTDTGGTSYTDQGSCKDKCKPPPSWYCDEGTNTCGTTDTGGTSYIDQGSCKDKCKPPPSWYCDEGTNTCGTTDTGGTSYTDQGSCKDKCKPPPASWYCDEGTNTCSTTDTGGTSYTDQGSCKDKCKPQKPDVNKPTYFCDTSSGICARGTGYSGNSYITQNCDNKCGDISRQIPNCTSDTCMSDGYVDCNSTIGTALSPIKGDTVCCYNSALQHTVCKYTGESSVDKPQTHMSRIGPSLLKSFTVPLTHTSGGEWNINYMAGDNKVSGVFDTGSSLFWVSQNSLSQESLNQNRLLPVEGYCSCQTGDGKCECCYESCPGCPRGACCTNLISYKNKVTFSTTNGNVTLCMPLSAGTGCLTQSTEGIFGAGDFTGGNSSSYYIFLDKSNALYSIFLFLNGNTGYYPAEMNFNVKFIVNPTTRMLSGSSTFQVEDISGINWLKKLKNDRSQSFWNVKLHSIVYPDSKNKHITILGPDDFDGIDNEVTLDTGASYGGYFGNTINSALINIMPTESVSIDKYPKYVQFNIINENGTGYHGWKIYRENYLFDRGILDSTNKLTPGNYGALTNSLISGTNSKASTVGNLFMVGKEIVFDIKQQRIGFKEVSDGLQSVSLNFPSLTDDSQIVTGWVPNPAPKRGKPLFGVPTPDKQYNLNTTILSDEKHDVFNVC